MVQKLKLSTQLVVIFLMGVILLGGSGCVPTTSRLVYSPSSTATTDSGHFTGTHSSSRISSSSQTLAGGNYQLVGTVSGTPGEASLTGGSYNLKLSRKEK